MKNLTHSSSIVYLLLLKLSLLSFFLFIVSPASGKSNAVIVKDSLVKEKSFTVVKDALIDISGRDAKINVSTWDQKKVEVKLKLIVTAWNQEELEDALKKIPMEISGNEKQVTISMAKNMSFRYTTGFKPKIKTPNGSVKIKNYTIVCDVKMPRSNSLKLENRYGDVMLGAHEAKIDLDLYECKLSAEKLKTKNAKITLKYCQGAIGDIGNAYLNLYETKLKAGEMDSLLLNSKYSGINLQSATQVMLKSYEDRIELEKASGMKGKISYGRMNIASIDSLLLENYELGLNIKKAGKIELGNSRFSNLNLGNVETLKMLKSYEDKVSINSLDRLEADVKFTNLQIAKLKKYLKITAYEGGCQVAEVDPEFESISVISKFFNASFNLHKDAECILSTAITYGNVSLPENKFNIGKRVKKGERETIDAISKGYAGKSVIYVEGYETNLNLQ